MAVKILVSSGNDPEIIKNYTNAISVAGGIPVARYLPEVDLSFDGLLLTGGVDIHPKYYGQEINGSVNMDCERDRSELELAKAYINAGKPVFGICRGCQLLNVVFGGTLVQHISCHERHIDGKFHLTTVQDGCVISELYGKELITNSYHHQAIDRLGDGLKPVQWSENGKIIECVEHQSLPIIAVQWHPERMLKNTIYYKDVQTAGAIDSQKLFEKFIETCKAFKG